MNTGTVNFSRNHNFKLLLQNNEFDIEYYTQGFSLPGWSIAPITIPRNEQTYTKPGQAIDFEELTLSIICDEKLQAFESAYDIRQQTKNPQTGTYDPINTVFDAKLILLSNKNNPLITVTFHDAHITSVSGLDFDSTGGSEIITFTINMDYSYYTIEREE